MGIGQVGDTVANILNTAFPSATKGALGQTKTRNYIIVGVVILAILF